MSILLDAVSRAKQEQHDAAFDPITAPRPVVEQKHQYGWLMAVVALLLALLLAAVAFIAWQHYGALSNKQVEIADKTVGPAVAQTLAPQVALAGKVTLPRPRQLPSTDIPSPQQPSVAPKSTISTLQTDERQKVAVESSTTSQEPIMLGANANEKGLAMLEQLKQNQTAPAAQQSQPSSVENAVGSQNTVENSDSGVNDELMNRFKAALSEVEKRNAINDSDDLVEQSQTEAKPSQYPSYGELPASLQLQVPEFSITAHLYATNPAKRWINVDGKELQQGDKIKQKLTVVEIRPNDVVLEIQGTRFRVPAV